MADKPLDLFHPQEIKPAAKQADPHSRAETARSKSKTATSSTAAASTSASASASTLTIGQRLQEARKRQGLSLEKASTQTRIHLKTLADLEEDRVSENLGEFYAKCFAKRYAKFLNLELDWESFSVAKTKKIPMMKTQPKPAKKSAPINIFPKIRTRFFVESAAAEWSKILAQTPAWILWVVGALLALLIVYWLSPKNLRAPSPEPMALKPAVQQTKSSTRSPEQPMTVANTLIDFKAQAEREVWMRVKSDGEVLFEGTLKSGEIKGWQSFKPFEVWVGDASALSFFINNQPYGSPGRGVLKNIRVGREGITAGGSS